MRKIILENILKRFDEKKGAVSHGDSFLFGEIAFMRIDLEILSHINISLYYERWSRL